MGILMQPVIIQAHRDDTGETLKPLDELEMVSAPRGVPMGAHFDAFNATTKRLHEVKNFGVMRKREFGEAGTDAVPMDVLVQCLHEMAVWNAGQPPYGLVDACEVDVLFGGQERCVYVVPCDAAALETLYTQLAAFWALVQTGQPPEPRTPEEARALFPRSTAEEKTATPDVLRAVDALRSIKHQIAGLEKQKDGVQAMVQNFMASAGLLRGPGGEVLSTWHQAKGAKRIDVKRLRAELPQVAARFEVEAEGARRFLLKE